ncbi:glycosyl transferase family 1 [Mycolicibacterium litorale]|nr:glycosyl transferase family 1 [Mycolicibacterium litorale]
MKFVLAAYGTRGDVEPSVVVARELQRRGHTVWMAVPPNLVAFAEEAGLTAVPYGLDSRPTMDSALNYFRCCFRTPWRFRELNRMARESEGFATQCWIDMTATLQSLADEADVLVTGLIFEQPAANVAELYDIPLVTLHYFPVRIHSQLVAFVPPLLTRAIMRANDRLAWKSTRKAEDSQRQDLGLPPATAPAPQRIAERHALEIQAYDEVCFPELAAEWAQWGDLRPFVGTLTLEMATDADDEVASWISAGNPPIFFGFGSVPVESPADMIAMIAAACGRLGERALVCAGWTDFSDVPEFDHVKIVNAVNYAAIFPSCRAVVHHGGAGTVATGLRAGVPQLILWTLHHQLFTGAVAKRLKVGVARRIWSINEKTLVEDLRTILAPEYRARAREVAALTSAPADSAAVAADLVENFARANRVYIQ